MADKWRTATGNYSTAAQWNGGTLPQPGDNIYANNFTCTIDVSEALMGLWSNLANAGLGVAAGGQFILGASVPGGTFTFSGDLYCGATHLFIASAAGVNVSHVSGVAYASTSGVLYGIQYTPSSGNGVLTLGGEYRSGSSGSVQFSPSGSGTFELVFSDCDIRQTNSLYWSVYTNAAAGGVRTVSGRIANLELLTNSFSHAVYFNGQIEGEFTIGHLKYGPGYQAVALAGPASSGKTVVVVVEQATRLAGYILSNLSGFWSAFNGGNLDVTMPGVVVDNLGISGSWAQAGGTSKVTYRGDITCGLLVQAFRANNDGSTVEHFGVLSAVDVFDNTFRALAATNGAKVILDKVNANTKGMLAISPGCFVKSSAEFRLLDTTGETITFVPSTSVGDPPAVTDVRDGVQYHFDTLTGTCKVPGASSVAAGVEIDHTVGTALVTSEALLSAMGLDNGNLTELIEALPTLEEIQENAVFVLPISYQQQSQLQGAWIRRAIGDASPMELRALKDANGAAINLSGKTLKLYVTTSGKAPTVVQTFNHADLTVFGDNDSVRFTPSTTLVGTVRKLLLSLRVVTTTEQEIVPGGIDIYRTAWTS